jgi:exodeoxyribonuclease V alpha subunit
VTERIPRRFGLDGARDVQVLTPMYRGACGVDALNVRLREAFGLGGQELEWRGRVWREGDRVLHTRNDYEREAFNGDLGRIRSVAHDGSGVLVAYPERDLFYELDQLRDLTPAFAITVHRSQGGEFPAVVIPLVTRHAIMLQRHLLYTAVTRAQRLLVLVGSTRALGMAIDNAETRHRESFLAQRLAELAER